MALSSEKQRKDFEEKFHNKVVEKQTQFLQFYEDDFLHFIEQRALQYLGDIHGKSILCYGCGVNWSMANRFYQKGGRVTMIDISGASIDLLKRKVKLEKQERFIMPIRMDCEHMEFDDNSFDLIYGKAILHHLNVDQALREISRVLRPGGRAVFLETLGMNPVINLFRRLTPSRRSPYEHPFTNKDFLKMNGYFAEMYHDEYTFITLFGIVINSILGIVRLKPMRLKHLQLADTYLLSRFPALKKYCWDVILSMQK